MKWRMAIIFVLTAMVPLVMNAQNVGSRSGATSGSGTQKPVKQGSAWVISDVVGQHTAVPMDTLPYNFQKQAVPSMYSDALATTGNLGAPSQNQIYFDRAPLGDFFFNAPLADYYTRAHEQRFYNVYIPITQLGYGFGGNRESGQERLKGFFAGNVNRQWGFGANIDYVYSKGMYANQAMKDFNFGFTGYYRGDRFESQALFNQWNLLNKENGGITNKLYITDPAQLQGGDDRIQAKSIPVNLEAAHSRVRGKQFYWNNAYKVGYWEEEEVNDTLTREVYVPVVKFVHTLDYQQGHHMFLDTSTKDMKFWDNHYFSPSETDDHTSYWKLANTLGISMIEGFKPWVKFNLSAYATYETRQYKFMEYTGDYGEDVTPLPEGFDTRSRRSQNLLWVGGRLAKDTGKHLRYEADARFGLIGDVVGDLELDGRISTRFKLLGDTVTLGAYGSFHNLEQQLPLKHYISNNFAWENDFGKTRRVRFGAEIDVPWSGTTLSGGMENVQNLIYFDLEGMPRQYGGSVQVLMFKLDQKLRFGIWNWNNTITFQHSSNSEVLPLPALSIYSNMFLHFTAFKVLDLQIGVDCDYFTRYRGVNYQPATMTFRVGEDWEIGNYPFCNVYVTAKLYKVRFYVMMTHVTQGLFGKDFFSMPLYPMNPRAFRVGLAVDFTN